jgi:hypothetical protein
MNHKIVEALRDLIVLQAQSNEKIMELASLYGEDRVHHQAAGDSGHVAEGHQSEAQRVPPEAEESLTGREASILYHP